MNIEEYLKDFLVFPLRNQTDAIEKTYSQSWKTATKWGIELLPRVYLHGKLWDKFDFDLATLAPIRDWERFKQGFYTSKMNPERPMFFLEGIFDVKIPGIDEECVLYAWTSPERYTWQFYGLVCLKSDVKACKYANRCFKKREYHI